MAINFISSVDNNEEGVMHSKSENIEKIINDEADEDKKFFKLLKNKYQNNLELRKGSEFIFYYVLSLYYKYHKVNLTCGVTLNHEEIGKNSEIIIKIKPYIKTLY